MNNDVFKTEFFLVETKLPQNEKGYKVKFERITTQEELDTFLECHEYVGEITGDQGSKIKKYREK